MPKRIKKADVGNQRVQKFTQKGVEKVKKAGN